ncbi:MAG: outer membrane beta-barrel protein [Pseudomonadota bacterium]
MKKIFTVPLITAACSVIANSTPFDGLYLGASAGYTQRNQTFSMNVTGIENGTPFNANAQKSKRINAFNYGLMTGYGYVTSGVYLGGEISLHHDTASEDENYSVLISSNSGNGSLPVKVRYNRSPVLGFAPRLGIVFAESYMAFIKPGVEISRDRIEIDAESRDTTSRKTKFTFVPGIGITKAVHNNLLVTISYDYGFGNKISVHSNPGDNATGNYSVKYTSHSFKAGVAYRF